MSESKPRIQGLRSAGEIAAEVVEDLAFRRKVQRLHDLGARVTAEMLAELGAERSIMTIIDQKLERYARLDPAAIEAIDNDFCPLLVHEVKSDDAAITEPHSRRLSRTHINFFWGLVIGEHRLKRSKDGEWYVEFLVDGHPGGSGYHIDCNTVRDLIRATWIDRNGRTDA